MNRAKREAGLLPATTHRGQKEEPKKKQKEIESKPEKPVNLTIRHPISPTERMVKVPVSFQQPYNPRLCKVALLGAANAGKSTIINSLIGENISVVSARAHTTRERILASWTKDNNQVVFLDTPGIIYGRNQSKMNRNLVNASWQSLIEADHLLVVVDAAKAISGKAQGAEDYLFERLEEFSIPATLILNKVDLITDMKALKDAATELQTRYPHFDSTMYISCFEEDDLQQLGDKLQTLTKSQDWIFPANQTSEMPDIKRVEDIIRAEFFQRLYGNLPYVLTQENVGWTELPNGMLRIDQDILVEHDSQQKIVKGAGGNVINSVLKSARVQIERALKRPVKLFLQIKTR
ncbi:P-loop containing nucleoside triphosphate hydrolase protein [Umbelopsis sp. AD052]|nr:P-loop containing nucleoside triphosphate hydrolase protein [Umbelopsis sp. AD052]